jgi:hypothetical protein
MLFAINESLLPILSSPVPFICGVVIDPSFVVEKLGFDTLGDFIDCHSEIVFF